MRSNHLRLILSNQTWRALSARIPDSRRCRGYADSATRRAVEGMLWIVRTGAPWRDLPRYFGKWNTVYRRYRRWALAGVWQRIYVGMLGTRASSEGVVLLDSTTIRAHQHAAGGGGEPHLQAIGISRGGRTTKLHVALGDDDFVVACEVTPGHNADISTGPFLLKKLRRPAAVVADRGYDADAFVAEIHSLGAIAVIPPRRGRRRPRPFDRKLYGERNRVERFFAGTKHRRRLATRYDKTIPSFLAGFFAHHTLQRLRTFA